jgi:hypothetical protein
MTPLATIAQLDAWLGRPAPADAPRLLDRASEVVAGAVRTAVKTDATTGLPTDPTTARTLADATCAQVESWLDGGSGEPTTEQSVDGVILNTDPLSSEGSEGATLAPHARLILRTGGLLNAVVSVR